jgi:lipopolysaccharide transport system ATP-binding protein
MSDSIIQVRDLSKCYIISHEGGKESYTALRDVVTNQAKKIFSFPKNLRAEAKNTNANIEEFWALNDVSFDIQQGDRIGIIGRNGAGKSTLLKILSRITEPTSGVIKIKGRIASLLEVGTGFHPELTGRENIYLNGAILGMSRAEIKSKFDEIVDFAEVEKFLDTPVKRYSSGMYVRLAFAVAAHLEPDILVIDEVLAVGDTQFQKKCLGKMEDVSKNDGRTVLFVSHNIAAIKTLTSKVLYLKKGMMTESIGSTNMMIDKYMKDSINLSADSNVIYPHRRGNRNPLATIESIEINNKENIFSKIGVHENITIILKLVATRQIFGVVANFVIKNAEGEIVTTIASYDSGKCFDLKEGNNFISLNIVKNNFSPGKYFSTFGIAPCNEGLSYDVLVDYPLFEIINDGKIITWLDRPFGYFISSNLVWSLK